MSDERRRTKDEGRRTKDDLSSPLGVRPSPAVELHIDELALHGFAPADRYRIGAAVEHELASLLTERGLPPSLGLIGELARLDGGAFELAPGMPAEAIGARIARAIYAAVGGGSEL